jgi:hypothetical protein
MRLSLIVAVLAVVSVPAQASKKPCRDASGKIIPCPKPSPQAQHRCKDAAGRFVKCERPAGPQG